MTTGPRETPHPIILHVDDQGNPVRLAEASSIYVTTVSAVTVCATNYAGLNIENAGIPVGEGTEIQFRKNDTEFDGDSSLTFDKGNQRLRAVEIVVGDLSSTNRIFSEETIIAVEGFSGASLSATSSRIGNLSATIVSAVTVCATNYNSLFDSLSFQNLDSRYLNSSGDSVTGSFNVESLSAATISATNWKGLPSSLATWNASSIQGIPVTSTPPSPLQTLIYKDGVWQPSSVAGVGGGIPGGNALSIQFNNGIFSGVDSVKYNESISGISLTTLSSTNLSSVNIRVTTISATTYENNGSGLPVWNAQKIQSVPVSKPLGLQHKDILAVASDNTTLEQTRIDDYAYWVYESIKPTIHAELPQTNASALRGVQVTATAPATNNVLIYNGSVWTPSSAISLGTVSATNLGGTNIVGTSASIVSVSSTNLSSVSARITGLSSTTISAINWQGLPSAVATWNASAIKGIDIVNVDANVTGTTIGAFIYSRPNNQYYTLPFSSTVIAGSRDAAEVPYQGQVVASYLGSASPEFQINPIWNSDGIKNLPSNNDVLVFKSDLYDFNAILQTPAIKAWTWQQPSSLVPAAGGYQGLVQFRGPEGQFSSDAGIYFNPASKILAVPNGIYSPNGSVDAGFISVSGGGTVSGTLRVQTVSATTYKLFGADTSAVSPTLSNNQTIIYDTTGTKWRPGYTVYQATATPDNSLGNNGDIYFQYIP